MNAADTPKILETGLALSIYDGVKMRKIPGMKDWITNFGSSAGYHILEEKLVMQLVQRWMPTMVKQGLFLGKVVTLAINELAIGRFVYSQGKIFGNVIVKSLIAAGGQEIYRMVI
jgi:hypothetical protein